MRAAAIIVAGFVAIIGAIIVQFYSAPHPNVAVVSEPLPVPEPSQMMAVDYTDSLIELLQQRDPDVWHQVAMGWNWDGGVAPLTWIVRQPQCDLGTALLIYWRGGPGFFKQYGSREDVPAYLSVELYDLLEDVEGRLTSGFYNRHEIAFNPRSDDAYDWTTSYKDIPANRKIPEQLYEAASGRVISKSCVYLPEGLRC